MIRCDQNLASAIWSSLCDGRLLGLYYKIGSLPFKGKGTLEAEQRVRVGMGWHWRYSPIPIPAFPLEGEGVAFEVV